MAQGRDVVPFTLRTLAQFTLAFDPTNLHTKGARIGSRSRPMALSLSGSLRKYQLKRGSQGDGLGESNCQTNSDPHGNSGVERKII